MTFNPFWRGLPLRVQVLVMRVVIRAFNKDGYHKDIVVMSEQQIHMADIRVDEDCRASIMSGLIGVGAGIDPSAFPELVRFEVVIRSA